MGGRWADSNHEAGGMAALNTALGTQGGFAVSSGFHEKLMMVAPENAMMRQCATVIPAPRGKIEVSALDHVTTPSARNPAFLGGLVAQWAEESSVRSRIQETEHTLLQPPVDLNDCRHGLRRGSEMPGMML
jgi:hypothetical protein